MYGQPTPVMLPPLHYQGMDAAQPFGYQPAPPGSAASPPGMHPSRIAALASGGPIGTPPQAGMIRGADEMEGAEGTPPAKRQKIAKPPGGQYYPEADWINMHPVSASALSRRIAKVYLWG
jgi:splicing factor 3A subunit 1